MRQRLGLSGSEAWLGKQVPERNPVDLERQVSSQRFAAGAGQRVALLVKPAAWESQQELRSRKPPRHPRVASLELRSDGGGIRIEVR